MDIGLLCDLQLFLLFIWPFLLTKRSQAFSISNQIEQLIQPADIYINHKY